MKNNENNKNSVKIFNFNESYKPPSFKYNAKRGIVEWGDDNNYPIFLVNLYNNVGSTTHKAIVNKKVKMISGNGFKTPINNDLNNFIKKNKLDFETAKITLDYELMNGYAFEVVYNREGTSVNKIKHIPFGKLRRGIISDEYSEPHFWFSNDWTQYRKAEYTPEYIKEFDGSNSGRQLYYYIEYNPASDGIYPIVGYSTSINWIDMDYQISVFHLNQLKQGYSPSFLLNFSTGIPTTEEQDMFFREFKREFSGAENGGKIILTYSNGDNEKPELIPIQLNDSDDRFLMLADQIERNIVMGAEIPPQLVVLTPGKLGSTEERDRLLIEFQISYIEPRQNNIENSLDTILQVNNYNEKLVLNSTIEDNMMNDKNNNDNNEI